MQKSLGSPKHTLEGEILWQWGVESFPTYYIILVICRRKIQILAIFHFKILSITSNHIFQVENLLNFCPKESLGGTMGKKRMGRSSLEKFACSCPTPNSKRL
jgi:hypothetical protein